MLNKFFYRRDGKVIAGSSWNVVDDNGSFGSVRNSVKMLYRAELGALLVVGRED